MLHLMGIKITAQKRKNITNRLRKGGWMCLLANICGALAAMYTIVDIIGIFDIRGLSSWAEDNDWLLGPFLCIGICLGFIAFLFGPTGDPEIMKEIRKRTKINVFVSSWDALKSTAHKRRLKKTLQDIANKDSSNWDIVFTSHEDGKTSSCTGHMINDADMAIVLFSRCYCKKYGAHFKRIKNRAVMGGFFVYPILIDDRDTATDDDDVENYSGWDEEVAHLRDWIEKIGLAPQSDDIPTLYNTCHIQDAYCGGDPQKMTWEKIRQGIEHMMHELEDYKSQSLPDFMLSSFRSGMSTQFSIGNSSRDNDDDGLWGVAVAVPLNEDRIIIAEPLNVDNRDVLQDDAPYVHCITEFWSNPPEVGSFITITGTISDYAPLIPGSPYKKRMQHLKFRKEEKDYDRESLNSAMAFTAGQMPWRLPRGEKNLHYMGLYQSITRNSIPVFMNDASHESLRHIIPQDIDSMGFEANITARVIVLPRDYDQLHKMNKWMSEHSFKSGKKNSVHPASEEDEDQHSELSDADPLYALEIVGDGKVKINADGKKYIDGVEYICPTKYLDGDIWVAVDHKGKTEVASRFCDLSDEGDIRKQIGDILMKELGKMNSYKVLHQFDEVQKRFFDKE